MKDFLETFGSAVLVVILYGLVFGVLMLIVNWTNSIQCRNKYASFQNRYSFWQKCQIKVKGKWIPADSYYFKED